MSYLSYLQRFDYAPTVPSEVRVGDLLVSAGTVTKSRPATRKDMASFGRTGQDPKGCWLLRCGKNVSQLCQPDGAVVIGRPRTHRDEMEK